ncbi:MULTISPECIES: 4'-phosphopantetheinyl transferase superfamily protein [unclassified Chitinophaga]|uniref:4'-phosphopantetheinyl transferase superfamily protein n=1 Tax=unclassified Chitinophaga TaxID=2619133 RepID=UPI0009CA2042|nr:MULTISPECIES: 4'-phosphopantetheinyl transferase superfamily protein [unclassified Chitinophaga]OMP76202.1 hypothetical protein BW716_26350 [[Flexibacter] sp. ATCC 35208]WPV65529.1 4'-phosphopantetheinyl transferase superfamily protein [Chitinophaga sp. LS1]
MKISSGIDIIEIATVKTLIDRHGERFLKRAFTEKEVAYCRDKNNNGWSKIPRTGNAKLE